jgi:hypothetical protein
MRIDAQAGATRFLLRKNRIGSLGDSLIRPTSLDPLVILSEVLLGNPLTICHICCILLTITGLSGRHAWPQIKLVVLLSSRCVLRNPSERLRAP